MEREDVKVIEVFLSCTKSIGKDQSLFCAGGWLKRYCTKSDVRCGSTKLSLAYGCIW